MEFNFNEWARLAKEDHVAFEEKREQVLKQLINKSTSGDAAVHRLEDLQLQIDMMRRQQETPISSHVKISGMMKNYIMETHEHVMESLNHVSSKVCVQPEFSLKKNITGNIIPFRKSKKP